MSDNHLTTCAGCSKKRLGNNVSRLEFLDSLKAELLSFGVDGLITHEGILRELKSIEEERQALINE